MKEPSVDAVRMSGGRPFHAVGPATLIIIIIIITIIYYKKIIIIIIIIQRISVLLFRFNSVLLHNSFELDDRSEH